MGRPVVQNRAHPPSARMRRSFLPSKPSVHMTSTNASLRWFIFFCAHIASGCMQVRQGLIRGNVHHVVLLMKKQIDDRPAFLIPCQEAKSILSLQSHNPWVPAAAFVKWQLGSASK